MIIKDYLYDPQNPAPQCCYWECLDNFTFYIHSQGNVAVEYHKNAELTGTISYVYGPTGIVVIEKSE